jgi:superfamily II DNA or RNA helicase
MGASPVPDIRGRLVTLGDDGATFIVLGASLGAGPRDIEAHLLRVSPPPVAKAGASPLSSLKTVAIEPPEGIHALALLASAAIKDNLGCGGTLFAEGADFKAFQFRPLLKYLKSKRRRILIADEAGLGKTIEAAYILTQEMTRRRRVRALILCPANLIHKWKGELLGKFGLLFEPSTGKGLIRLLESGQGFRAIVSFDCLKGNMPALKSSKGDIDFLVVDEVHHAIGSGGAETGRRTLAKELSRRSSCVVALSATPIQLEKDDLRRVLEVVLAESLDSAIFRRDVSLAGVLNAIYGEAERGRAEGFEGRVAKALREARRLGLGEGKAEEIRRMVMDALAPTGSDSDAAFSALSEKISKANPFAEVVTRTRRRDVGEERARLPVNHIVTLSSHVDEFTQTSEAELFFEVDAFLSQSFTHVHRLQLASSLPAMANLLRGGMRGFPVWQRGSDAVGQLEHDDDSTEGGFVQYDKTLDENERRRCEELVGKFDRLGIDSKWNELAKVLLRIAGSDPPRKAVVFTQWVPTLDQLRERAKELRGIRAFFTTGADSDLQKEATIERFHTCGGSAVLFSTDFLSEGVDLQFADTVVNYDFPYNPQRVEQRIGRIDRVGQSARTIEIHNFWVDGSVDDKIREVFEVRMNSFREALGDSSIITGTESWEQTGRPHARHRNDVKLVKELNESSIYSGPEDFLDAEVLDLRQRNRGDLGRLAWLVVAQALALTTGLGPELKCESEYAVAGPIEEPNLKAVREWVKADRNEYGAVAESLLFSHRDEDLVVKLAKRPGSTGLYVPPTSPLALAAAKACWNYFGGTGPQSATLRFKADKTRPFEGAMIVCRYEIASASTIDAAMSYWNEFGGSASKVEGEQMLSLQRWLDDARLTLAREDSPPASSETRKAVEKDFDEWVCSTKPGSRGPRDAQQEANIRYIAVIS